MSSTKLPYGRASFDIADLATNTAVTPDAYVFSRFPLCKAQFPEPTESVLSLTADSGQSTKNAARSSTLLRNFHLGDTQVGYTLQQNPVFCAGVEVTLLNYNQSTPFKADWVCGSYQLPPAQGVEVALVAYRQNAAAAASNVFNFEAAVLPGRVPGGARFTVTSSFNLFNAATQQVHVHPLARWADFWCSNHLVADANAGVVTYWNNGSTSLTATPVVKRDYNAATWFPTNQVFEIQRPVTQGYLRNDGAAVTVVTFKQYLEL